MRRAFLARSVCVCTFMPGVGCQQPRPPKTRSPSISTMQTRQLPSGGSRAWAGSTDAQPHADAGRPGRKMVCPRGSRLLAVDGEGVGLLLVLMSYHQAFSGFVSSREKLQHAQATDWGRLTRGPQIEASRIAAESSSSSGRIPRTLAISAGLLGADAAGRALATALVLEELHQVSATAFMSSCSDRMTTRATRRKQPYFSSMPKSSAGRHGSSRIPPDAPPADRP